MAQALSSNLNAQLRALLTERIAALVTDSYDLTDCTEYLIIEPGDTEANIIKQIGFSPLVEPINGARFGGAGFMPYWDWLMDHDGVFEMTVSFGSTFAYVLLIRDVDGVLPDLRRMCRTYSEGAKA